MDRPHRYDAFLSYRHQEPDNSFARDLLARLEKAGYTVAIDERDFVPNLSFLQEMERCVRESRFTLAVVSPRYLESGNCEEEAVICTVLDMGERKRRLLPLEIEKVETPVWMYKITGIDFTAKGPLLDPYEKLERTLGIPLRLSDPDRFQIHPRVGEVFAGRETELDDIEKSLLGQGRPVAICALQGMPGVGKSYLADRFYHLHTARFQGGYQRLVLDPAGPDPTTDSLLGELADRLKLQPDPLLVRERLLHPRTLLHVENVDSKPLAQATAGLVAKLPSCPIVVTGRYQGLGIDAGWGRVEVRPLSEDDALDQLTQELGDGSREGEDAYRRLVRELGFLPLAIHLAAGHLRAGRTVDGFLERLRATGLALEPDDDADPALASRGRAILASTFNLSLDLLRDQLVRAGADADRLLAGFHALSQAPASGFGASLGAAIADLSASELEELVVNAGKLSLLDSVPATERPDRAWRIHPLLAELLQHRQGNEEGRRAFDRMTDWFASRLPQLPSGQEEETGRNWKEIERELSALPVWLSRLPPKDQVKVLRAGFSYAMRLGPYRAWSAFCENLLRATIKGDERSDALWMLIYTSYYSGSLDRAMAAARENVKLNNKHGNHHRVVNTIGAIADILKARGQVGKALKIQRKALNFYSKVGDIRSHAITLGKIADLMEKRGEFDEALRIRREEELPVYKKSGDLATYAITLGQITDSLLDRGDLHEALTVLREEVLPTLEKFGDRRSYAYATSNIARILHLCGQSDQAIKILQELNTWFEKVDDSYAVLTNQVNLAQVYVWRNRPSDRETAKHLLHLALEAAERLRIPEADQILEILRALEDPEGVQE